MNEIEKMYNNCNLSKPHAWSCKLDRIKFSGFCCELHKKGLHCKDCNHSRQEYHHPSFTTEKQLEITKFIGLHYGFQMLKNEAFDYIIATKIFVKYELEYKGYGYGYDEAIANLVNNLWQSLSEEEKQQIKEILE